MKGDSHAEGLEVSISLIGGHFESATQQLDQSGNVSEGFDALENRAFTTHLLVVEEYLGVQVLNL